MEPIENRLSLSTCWCSHRHVDGYDMLMEMRELGFSRVELSHGIRMLLVPGILKAREEGWIEVSSLHNFCPLPSGVEHAAPNLFEPSSRRSGEQMLFLRYSKRTMEFARQVGATRVVMHSGSVFFAMFSPETALSNLPETGERNDYRVRERAFERVRRKSTKPRQRVIDRYHDLLGTAKELGIELGLENREGVLELPLDEDWSEFLKCFPDSPQIGAWHDTGHARIKEMLGLLDHRKHLEELSDRLIGFHLHDVSEEGRDHQVPGTGTVDFSMVKEFIRPGHTLVAELSPRLTREEVVESRDYLCDKLSG